MYLENVPSTPPEQFELYHTVKLTVSVYPISQFPERSMSELEMYVAPLRFLDAGFPTVAWYGIRSGCFPRFEKFKIVWLYGSRGVDCNEFKFTQKLIQLAHQLLAPLGSGVFAPTLASYMIILKLSEP